MQSTRRFPSLLHFLEVNIRQDVSPRQGSPGGHDMLAAVTFSKFLQIAKFCTTTIFASATLKIDALCNTQLLMHEISPHETYGKRFVSTNAIHSTISVTFALSQEIRPLCKTLAPPNLSPTNFLEAELFTQPN